MIQKVRKGAAKFSNSRHLIRGTNVYEIFRKFQILQMMKMAWLISHRCYDSNASLWVSKYQFYREMTKKAIYLKWGICEMYMWNLKMLPIITKAISSLFIVHNSQIRLVHWLSDSKLQDILELYQRSEDIRHNSLTVAKQMGHSF